MQSAIRLFFKLLNALQIVTADWIGFTSVLFRNRTALAAENVFSANNWLIPEEAESSADHSS